MLNYRRLWVVTGLGVALLFGSIRSSLAADRQFLRGHIPEIVSHLQPTGRYPGTNHLNLAIGLPLRNEAALDELLQQICDPASPNYRQYLTPEQFAERFGPTEQDYQALIAFAEKNGLTVKGTYPNRTLLDVSGSVVDIERVFHVTMRSYQHPSEKRRFHAPDTEPSLDLAVPILHISGLDDFVKPRPMSLKLTPLKNATLTASTNGSGPSGLYMGNDFRAAYAPGVYSSGNGQMIGLLELDGYYTNDITAYENLAGLPNVALTNILIDSFSGAPGGNNGEVALDIEMAISMATNVPQVIVYEGPNPGNPVDILARIASDNLAKQISSSWLIGDDPNADVQYKNFAAQGQSFFQASGDDGAYYSGISEWADDTNITLVGGTTLTMTGKGVAWSLETVWNWYSSGEGTAGSGGGINFNSVPIPSWQQGINMTTNKGSTTLRNVPDVALTADNIFIIADNGQQESVGGTSAAAPLWAGFTALINEQAIGAGRTNVGFLNPAIYAIGKSTNFLVDFHDITTGNNTNTTVRSKYYAVPGYDLCTGWGTPNGQNMINALGGPPDPMVIIPSSGFYSSEVIGGPFTITSQPFTLTNSGAASLNWQIASSPWLNVSSTSGTLPAGGQTSVTVSLNSTVSNLVAGTYIANVWFTNQSSGGVQNRHFTLQVIPPLAVIPATGFTANGPVGGPFNVTSQSLLLTNLGPVSLDWSLNNTSLWLNASPISGTLAPDGFSLVTASLNATVNSLTTAVYTNSLLFTNLTSPSAVSVQFTLNVGQSMVQNGGFETGDFTGWTLTDDIYSFVDNGSVSGITPHSGSYFAALGQSGALGYLSQTLSTVSNQVYLISLWFNNPLNIYQVSGGYATTNVPNEFSVSWNGTVLFDQVDIPPTGWTNLQFIATATGTTTTLQFGERVDPWYLGLDDVNLWPIPNPSFRSVAKLSNSNAVFFSWNSMSNFTYQVLYSTNLVTANWVPLITNTAAGPILTYTNSYGADPQRFYRIRRSP